MYVSRGKGLFFWLTAVLLFALLIACAFNKKLTANLRSENFNIAQALVAGQGFADAIGEPTGPTAWSAPGYPVIQAGLLWAGQGSRHVVVAGLVVLHVLVLCGTGLLVLELARRSTSRMTAIAVAGLFFLAVCFHLPAWFELAQDCWLMLLMFNLLLVGACWLMPAQRGLRAALWGLVGGLCALVNPSIGFAWAVLCLLPGLRGDWRRMALSLGVAAAVVAPWTIRNYLVFGRLIPIKSNLVYELYQSQCLQPGGLLQMGVFATHPSHPGSTERQEYKVLGEVAFLDRKREQVWQAVRADPVDFLERVATRFLAATVWYVPFRSAREPEGSWGLWVRRLTYPLPFLAAIFLIWTAFHQPLTRLQTAVLGIYACYLLPYVLASFYERYVIPLVAIKLLLVVWAADRLLEYSFANRLAPYNQALPSADPS
jgi:hypothetical protein